MFRSGLCTAVALVLSLSAAGSAQVSSPEARSYDARGLRIEGKRLVRGTSGDLVLRIGPHTDVARRVEWLSDSARAYASTYQPRRSMAANLRLLAWGANIASVLLGYQVYRDYKRQADAVTAQQDAGVPVTARIELDQSKLLIGGALSTAGLVARWTAGRLDESARTSLARAVWWHNREIR